MLISQYTKACSIVVQPTRNDTCSKQIPVKCCQTTTVSEAAIVSYCFNVVISAPELEQYLKLTFRKHIQDMFSTIP